MENRMSIVITMAGLGNRFRKAGYNCPKYMIEAKGKSLFEWSMDSLIGFSQHSSKYIFVVRKEDKATDFIKEKCKQYDITEIEIIELDGLTDGQATTALLAIPYVNLDDAFMVYNIDTYVEPYEMRFNEIEGDGYIPCFYAEGDHWSFVKLDENGNAIEVREKQRISDNCTLGAYYFSSAKLYKKIYEEYYKDAENVEKSEKYIAPMYNYMIQKGYIVKITQINSKKVHVLGTPEELEEFKLEKT